MEELEARGYLTLGLYEIESKRPEWDRREEYYRGKQDLPFAPIGVSQEYLSLREQSVMNWLGLATDTPIQRLRAEGFRTGRDRAADADTWNEIWQPNKLDSRQRIVYTQMRVHARGLMSVWPNAKERKQPIIRPENGRNVHLQMDPEDPFTPLWAVKTFTVAERPPSSLVLPVGVTSTRNRQVGTVYDATSWMRFERGGQYGGDWTMTGGGTHPLGDVPFVPFDNNQDAEGIPQSSLSPLMPAQDALNTIRFQTLLALQFSAFRQRIISGYDPIMRDDKTGEIVFRKNPDGTPVLDGNGQPMPVVTSFGRVGVDRALVFPDAATKVFDMQESNLDNYIKVLGEFLSDLFAVGQVPPQYLLNRMANLSGDALAGAESTLQSLVADLQRWTGESLEQVMRLANRARGTNEPDLASEVVWADAEARSFAQTVDGIVKLVQVGLPKRAAFEMVPNTTPPTVDRWMEMSAEEAGSDPMLAQVTRSLNSLGTGDNAA